MTIPSVFVEHTGRFRATLSYVPQPGKRLTSKYVNELRQFGYQLVTVRRVKQVDGVRAVQIQMARGQ